MCLFICQMNTKHTAFIGFKNSKPDLWESISFLNLKQDEVQLIWGQKYTCCMSLKSLKNYKMHFYFCFLLGHIVYSGLIFLLWCVILPCFYFWFLNENSQSCWEPSLSYCFWNQTFMVKPQNNSAIMHIKATHYFWFIFWGFGKETIIIWQVRGSLADKI